MPRMRGTEAAQRIRQLGYNGVIIGVTGNALPEDVKDFIDHGADAVIPKPFDIDVFKRYVSEYHIKTIETDTNTQSFKEHMLS